MQDHEQEPCARQQVQGDGEADAAGEPKDELSGDRGNSAER